MELTPAVVALGFTLLSAFVGGIVWFVRLEGRVNQLEKLFSVRDKYLDERHNEVKVALVRIDTKLDRLLNTPS
jgi:hypothetical protein